MIPAMVALAVSLQQGLARLSEGVVSTGAIVALEHHIKPESPTLFLFYRPAARLEADLVKRLQFEAGKTAGVKLVQLRTGKEPIAVKYEVSSTPMGLVYDRRRRLVTRSGVAEELLQGIAKASEVMRIDWAENGSKLLEEASQAAGGRPLRSGIMRTMSLQPEYLKHVNDLARKAHFQDGYLSRKTKELIATYVSAINHCKF